MKKLVFLLWALSLWKPSAGQVDSSDYKATSLYIYRTEEDFFNKKKIYRGQYLPSDTRVIKYRTSDSKKGKLNLEDSCKFYFGYQVGDEIKIRPDDGTKDYTYYVFGGGTINAYCVVYGQWPNYDKQGYLLGLSSPGGFVYMYFNDRINNLRMVQLDEFLKSKPKLLDKYKNEKSETDKKTWERNKLAIGIKYLKLFTAENNPK